MKKGFFFLSLLTVIITFILISFGAIVRLFGAGLACPDWPLCYGEIIPPEGFTIALEVGHRYLAFILGICIVLQFILCFLSEAIRPLRLWCSLALGTVIFQGILGGLTVILKLHIISVILHLVFGNILFALLILVFIKNLHIYKKYELQTYHNFLSIPTLLFFNTVFYIMIISGGLNSSSYAGYACEAFPLCHSNHPFSFSVDAPQLPSGIIETTTLLLPQNYLEWIHMAHRTIVVLGSLILLYNAYKWISTKFTVWKVLGYSLATILCMEFTLGVLNALWRVPIPISALHTTFASILAAILVIALGVSMKTQITQRSS